jgi:hypothetical protein
MGRIITGIGRSAYQVWQANILTAVSDMFPEISIWEVICTGGMCGGLGNITVAKTV